MKNPVLFKGKMNNEKRIIHFLFPIKPIWLIGHIRLICPASPTL